MRIASELGLDAAEIVRIRRAGLLHDIGTLSVPNRVLDNPARSRPASGRS
jgi:HD-GYP domain-containing protein (c-di-GMP phosphodiesterase class II)